MSPAKPRPQNKPAREPKTASIVVRLDLHMSSMGRCAIYEIEDGQTFMYGVPLPEAFIFGRNDRFRVTFERLSRGAARKRFPKNPYDQRRTT